MNTTVPAGMGPVPAITVATNISCGSTPEVDAVPMLVIVGMACMAWVRALEVLGLSYASPLYAAEMMWLPTSMDELLKVALPEPSRGAVPAGAPSTENTTLPVGVPPLPVTAAGKVTVDSTVAGEPLEATATDVVER